MSCASGRQIRWRKSESASSWFLRPVFRGSPTARPCTKCSSRWRAPREKFLAGQAAQRIEDEKGAIAGKNSPLDLLRGLETNYARIQPEEAVSQFGFDYIWKSMRSDLHLGRTRSATGAARPSSYPAWSIQPEIQLETSK